MKSIHYAIINKMLLERFGEPIADAEPGEGVKDERSGEAQEGLPLKNRGFGSGNLENKSPKT